MMVCSNCGYTGDQNTYVCPMCGAQMYYQDDNQYYGNYGDQQNTYDQAAYGQDQYNNGYYYNDGNNGYADNNYQQYDGYYPQEPMQQQMPSVQPTQTEPEKKKLSFSLGLKKKDKATSAEAANAQQVGVTNDGRQFFIPDAKKKTKRTSNSTIIIVTTIFAVLIVLTIYLTGGDGEETVVTGLDIPRIVSAFDNTLNVKSADFTISYDYMRIDGNFEVGNSTSDTKFYAESGSDEETLITGNYYTNNGGLKYSVTENYDNEIGFELVKNGCINKDGLAKTFANDDKISYEAFYNKLNKFANDLIVDSNYMTDYFKSYEIVESTQTLVTYKMKIDMKALCNEANRVVGTKLDAGKYKGISTVTITIDNNYVTVLALKLNHGENATKIVLRLSDFNTAKVDVTVCNKIKTDAEQFMAEYGSLFPDDKHTSIFDCFNFGDDDDSSDDSDYDNNYDYSGGNEFSSDVSSALTSSDFTSDPFYDGAVSSDNTTGLFDNIDSQIDSDSSVVDDPFGDTTSDDGLTTDDGYTDSSMEPSDDLSDDPAADPFASVDIMG